MKLIKYIGTKRVGSKMKSYSLYECPHCGSHTEKRNDSIDKINSCCCLSPFRKKHGESGTRLYTVWTDMKRRCNNNYRWYEHVSICDDWQSYIPFREWAMRHGYTKNLTIDRIDSRGNYDPDNCQFITQAENTRKAMLTKKETTDE